VGQVPFAYNSKPSSHRGYIFDSKEPLFPFGFGLSYTTFEIGTPALSAAKIGKDGSLTVRVDVRNTGKVAGDEVVQLYVRDLVSSVTRPVKELRGFKRVTLAPGAATSVEFKLDREALAFYDKDMKWVVEPGTFEVMVGADSVKLKSASFEVTP
jgi:beta-glucosidase